MTKDRPRNRPGKPGKQGNSGGRDGRPWSPGGGGGEPGGRSGGSQPAAAREGRGASGRGDFKSGFKSRPPGRPQFDRREPAFEENGEVWIWGLHAAKAALANPMRRISKAYVSPNAAARAGLDPQKLPAFASLMEPRDIDERLPPGAVHQGLAVRCKPLDGPDIADVVIQPDRPLVILDQVTDPQNVGAIFRSAAAFGVAGVVMQTRNAPALGGALAKAAAGAIEDVAEIRAVNISRAIDALTDAGWTVIGLDGTAELSLAQALDTDGPVAIVMGAEGEGIRQGVAKACSMLARIPMQPGMESLNVSNAAAIAFYEAARRKPEPPPLPPREAEPDDAHGNGREAD